MVASRESTPAKEPAYLNGFVDGSDLVLLYRDERGQMLARRRRAEWSSFYRREQVSADVMRDLRNSSFVVGVSEEKDWVRVRWQAPEWRRKAHEEGGWAETAGLTAYEADVSEVARYFQETGAEVAKPRRVYLDIETDSRVPPAVARQGKARVLCWSLVDEDVRVVAQGLLREDTDEDERRVLEEFWRAIDPYDQVVAWYGDGFDFPIVKLRSQTTGANGKDPRRWLWLDFMPVYERMNRNAANSGAEKESMRLQDVAMSRLGEGKTPFDASKTWEEWAAGGERRQRLVDYCAQDTKLLPKLERKTGFLDVNDAICQVSRQFADTQSANPTSYVDGFLLRMGHEQGLRFPSRARYGQEEQKKHEQFAGAFVMEPKCHGIERDIHVVDFSGMYPSIILTWNMSPETKRAIAVNGPIPAGHCRSPSTRVGFSTEHAGILCEAVKKIRAMRKHYQKLQASLPPGTPEWTDAGRLSTAYKVIANAFYGVVGSPFSRFFDRQIAESVSQNGVWLAQKTRYEAETRGMEVVYMDTDSLFVRGTTREAIAAFVEWCNAELYPKLVAECGCVDNHVEIAYEKEFERLVFVSAKKYTATYRHYKWTASCACDTAKGEPGALDVRTMTCTDCGKTWGALPPPRGEPEIRGLEYKRGDVIRIARKLQWDVVQKLMRGLSEDPADFVPMVEAARDHVLNDALPVEDVRLSKSLSKSLREYKPKAKDGRDGGRGAAARPGRARPEGARRAAARGRRRSSTTSPTRASSPMKVAPAADYAERPRPLLPLGEPDLPGDPAAARGRVPAREGDERRGPAAPGLAALRARPAEEGAGQGGAFPGAGVDSRRSPEGPRPGRPGGPGRALRPARPRPPAPGGRACPGARRQARRAVSRRARGEGPGSRCRSWRASRRRCSATPATGRSSSGSSSTTGRARTSTSRSGSRSRRTSSATSSGRRGRREDPARPERRVALLRDRGSRGRDPRGARRGGDPREGSVPGRDRPILSARARPALPSDDEVLRCRGRVALNSRSRGRPLRGVHVHGRLLRREGTRARRGDPERLHLDPHAPARQGAPPAVARRRERRERGPAMGSGSCARAASCRLSTPRRTCSGSRRRSPPPTGARLPRGRPRRRRRGTAAIGAATTGTCGARACRGRSTGSSPAGRLLSPRGRPGRLRLPTDAEGSGAAGYARRQVGRKLEARRIPSRTPRSERSRPGRLRLLGTGRTGRARTRTSRPTGFSAGR